MKDKQIRCSKNLTNIEHVESMLPGTFGRDGGPSFGCSGLGKKALGGDSNLTALFLFPYLCRRFGPTWFGSDDRKELCRYILSTKIEGLYLVINCKGGSLSLCFEIFITVDLAEQLQNVSENLNGLIESYREALVHTIRELTRPVYVDMQDMPFNIFGEAKEYNCKVANYSEYSGWAIPKEAMDNSIKEKL